ncbi:haloacid dehalogenase-like hydrolase [Prolixibacteraceae bacterium JC049]|nr:haloacid dehalogenase-like hydrolase [Prolixibacteraceae bacterium JC049]
MILIMNKMLYVLVLMVIALASCKNEPATPENKVVLDAWNDGAIKTQITKFLERDTVDIPIKDRIAVFDMDGTIACETPLWFEMYCAVAKMNDNLKSNPSLIDEMEYKCAERLYKDPKSKCVREHWSTPEANYIDSIIWKAFEGVSHEEYVKYCTNYLTTAVNKDKKMVLGDMFYKPMVQLLHLLLEKHYKVYVVSGSVQGVIWSIVPQKTPLKERKQLVGTRQILTPKYTASGTKFIIKKGIFTPKNNNAGKSENIYSKLGVQPIFAFGNTTGDFDMLQYAITHPRKGVGFMLNHDDKREYVYPPYHGKPEPDWKERIDSFGGVVVSMKNDFKKVWIK